TSVTVPLFIEAEDGVRGFHVTGVQTCALPIYFGITTAILKNVGRRTIVYICKIIYIIHSQIACHIMVKTRGIIQNRSRIVIVSEIGRASRRERVRIAELPQAWKTRRSGEGQRK